MQRSKHPPTPEWLEAAFLEEFLLHPGTRVSHYQECFPGHEAGVAELYERHAQDEPAARRDESPRIGRYVLRTTVGRGGQGTVYRAHDPELDRFVAIKVGHPHNQTDSSAALRLVREARVGARLTHPGICPVLDHGIQDGSPYVVMPFLEGWSLRQLLEVARERERTGSAMEEVCQMLGLFSSGEGSSASRGRQAKVVGLIERVASAMAVAHANGIVHRDLKPANILVSPRGEPVILDLGLAKDQSNVLPTLTGGQELLGTPAYAAPEQLRMHGRGAAIGPPADVWALGVVLVECLTGERPFLGPSREQLYRQILDANPRPLRELLGPVPRDLQVLVDVALQKDPRRRYASARELAEDLGRFRQKLPIQARAPGPWTRLWLWTRRKPALAATILALFVSLLAAVVAMVFLLKEQERNVELASERYAAMRAVSHDIVFDLVQRLGSVPGTAQVRLRLVDRAVEYLEILNRENPGDRELQEQAIRARMRLGDALGSPANQDLGMPAAALEQFRQARKAVLQLPGANRLLGECDSRLGTVLLSLGRFAEARKHLRLARSYWGGLHAAGGASLREEEYLFGSVAELSTCARELGELEHSRELAREAIAIADRLVERAGSEDPLAFESAAQTTQVACVLRKRLGRPREALRVLESMYPRLKELADEHPERERLQHGAIVFGGQIGELLMTARRVDEARIAYDEALARLDRGQQHGLQEANRRLHLHLLFEYGRGLTNLHVFDEGLRHLDAAAEGCKEILRVTPDQPAMQKLYRHVQMHKSLAHADAGRHAEALPIINGLAKQYLEREQWTEEELRDRGQIMMTHAQVLALARDYEAVQRLLARELGFFKGQRFGDARDKVRDATVKMLDRYKRKLETFLEGLQRFK